MGLELCHHCTSSPSSVKSLAHDDVIKWKHFSRPWPLCREFARHRWIPLTKAMDAELWCFLWSAPWIYRWVNNREAGDLRGHRAHYDIIVMRHTSGYEHRHVFLPSNFRPCVCQFCKSALVYVLTNIYDTKSMSCWPGLTVTHFTHCSFIRKYMPPLQR